LQVRKDGGSRLRAIKANLNAAEWDIVAATTLNRMGLGTPGAQNVAGDLFRHTTFFTNWSKLAPEAKVALYGGTRYKALVKDLDRLTRTSAALKHLDEATNFSNTTTASEWVKLIKAPARMAAYTAAVGATGLVFGGVGAVAALAGPYVAAKVWTNPNFVKWMASASTVGKHVSASGMAKFKATQAARLLHLAGDDEETQFFTMLSRIFSGDLGGEE